MSKPSDRLWRRLGEPSRVEDDDVIGTAGEVSPLIACDTVDAICRSVEATYYQPYHETRIVLTFKIVEPAALANQRVQLFCRKNDRWKYTPESSALFKAACAAQGRRLHRDEKITKKMFLNHMFRCRLRASGKGHAAYTVVDKIIERLA
jgi:hypothetical protein